MFSKYFGNYLLNKGIITGEQLNTLFNEEKNTHVKLGILALNKGYMTLEQIEKVNFIQMSTDKRFGEIAIEEGYLTANQLDELLSGQKTSYLLLCQIMLDKEMMTLEEIKKHLEDYKNENGLTAEDLELLTSDNLEVIINNSLKTTNISFIDYVILLAKNIERHLKEKVFVEEVSCIAEDSSYIAKQTITGDYGLHTYLSMDETGFIKFGSLFAEEELSEVDELCKSSVLEFLNLQNGIFVVNEVDKGVEVDLQVQSFETKLDASEDAFNVKITFGSVNCYLTLVKS